MILKKIRCLAAHCSTLDKGKTHSLVNHNGFRFIYSDEEPCDEIFVFVLLLQPEILLCYAKDNQLHALSLVIGGVYLGCSDCTKSKSGCGPACFSSLFEKGNNLTELRGGVTFGDRAD